MKRFHSLFCYLKRTTPFLRTIQSSEKTLSTAFIANTGRKNRSYIGLPLLVSISMDRNKETQQNEHITRQKYSTKITEQKEKYLHMPLEEKRDIYKCGNKYKTLEHVQTWEEYYNDRKDALLRRSSKKSNLGKTCGERREVRPDLNKKVSLWRGDITTLEIDAIVNAANESLLGGGGVDGAIHRAAGKKLVEECATLRGCRTGNAKITGGYKLPAKYVIHTVGPIGEQKEMLKSAYTTCLKLVKDNELVSVAFPCISTGIYGYANEKAAPVAIETVRNWLEDKEIGEKVERVIFCLFLQKDVDIYEELMQHFFPIVPDDDNDRPNKKSDKDDKVTTLDENGEIIKPKKLKKDNETKYVKEKEIYGSDSENKPPEDEKMDVSSENKSVVENKTEFHSKNKYPKDQKMADSSENESMNEKEMEVDFENKSTGKTKMDSISDNKSPAEKKMDVSDGENNKSSEKDMEVSDKASPSTKTKGEKESSSDSKGEKESPSKTKGEKESPSKTSGNVSKPITRKNLMEATTKL